MAVEVNELDHRSGLTVVSSLFAVPSRRELFVLYDTLASKASKAAWAVNEMGFGVDSAKGIDWEVVKFHLIGGADVYSHAIGQIRRFGGLKTPERVIVDEEFLERSLIHNNYRRRKRIRNWKDTIPRTLNYIEQHQAAVNALILKERRPAILLQVSNFLVNQNIICEDLALQAA